MSDSNEVSAEIEAREGQVLARIAIHATERAVESRKWLARAKQQRNHNMALSNDRLACMYESQCIKWAEMLMAALEKRATST